MGVHSSQGGSHHRNLQIPPIWGPQQLGGHLTLWLLSAGESHGIVQPGSIGAWRRAPQGGSAPREEGPQGGGGAGSPGEEEEALSEGGAAPGRRGAVPGRRGGVGLPGRKGPL